MKITPMLGEFELDGIEYVESVERRALVEHRVPGLAGSYYQDMGSAPNAILIVGTQTGDQKRDDFLTGIRDIFNAGEPTTFTADINTATDLTDVVIQDLHVSEVGGASSTFRYAVTLRRYVEPPEPPATDLLDAGILDDALSVTDALDALDALSSVPDFGDPTPPLRESLSGVEGATEELPAVVDDVNGLTDALPSETPDTAKILAPVVGDKDSGTGVAGVLGLLEQVDTSNLSASLSADLDQSVSAKLSVDTTGITGGALDEFTKAVDAVPQDPATLTQPVSSKLDTIKQLAGPELSNQLLQGFDGLKDIENQIPSDTSSLIEAAASRLSQVKGEMIRGEFGEVIQWSENVAGLHAEVKPLLEGAGTLEERLTEYLRQKVAGIVALILPGGDLVASLAGQFDAAAPTDLAPRLEALKADLIAKLGLAKAEFDGGNLSNTARLAEAEAAFQALLDLLASITATLRPLVDHELLKPEALTARLEKQFDDFSQVEIVDLGNIKDKFASGLKKVEDFISGIDLSAVTDGIESVFANIDGLIQKIDLRQFTSRLGEVKEAIQSALDAIDGALLEAVAAIRNVFTTIKDAIKSVAENLGSYDADGTFHYTVETQIQEFLAGISSSLRDTVQPLVDELKQTVGETLQQVQSLLSTVKGEIDNVKNELQSSLQGIHEQLQSVDVPGTMVSIRDRLDGMLNELGTIDFDVVVDPVVAEINEMSASMKKIDVSKLNEFAIGALKVSVEIVVHLDFSTMITAALMAEIDKLLEYPKQALATVEEKVEGAIKQFGELAPAALLAPLNDLFAPITEKLNALKLEALLAPLDEWYGRMEAQIDAVSPAALLTPLIDLYLRLENSLTAVSPAALVQPLQAAIDGIKADIRSIDVSSLAGEVTGAIDRVKQQLQKISPAGLLTPLVNVFDKIMGALDQFDPAALLKPFSDLFDAVAGVLANLTADGVKAIGAIFAVLRDLADTFDPRRVFALIREKLAGVRAVMQQVDMGGLLASLKSPFDAMQASFSAHAGPADVSITARVEGLNPLRNPKLGQIVSDVQFVQSRLTALADAQPPAALVERYDKVRETLEGLFPVWAGENVSAASIKRAFEAANPLNLKAEIDAIFGAVKDKVRTFDPRQIQTRLQTSFDKLQDSLFGFAPELLTEAQQTIDALTARLDVIDLRLITTELQGVVDEIMAIVRGLDPRPIIASLQGIVDEVKAIVASLRPSILLADLQAPFDAAKAIVAEFDPASFTEPLVAIFEDIQKLLAEIDVGVVLEPLAARLQQLRDALEEALTRTEGAFNGMLKAIPV